jgi:phosphotransferase system enzyme I (PtsI)
MAMITGISASQGIGLGQAAVYKETNDFQRFAERKVTEAEIENEVNRFESALVTAVHYLEDVKDNAAQLLGEDELQLFEAYQMLLNDPQLNEMVVTNIKVERLSAEAAVLAAVAQIRALFAAIDNEYLRQRADDVENVGKHIMDALLGMGRADLARLAHDTVLIASDLTPADTVALDLKHIKGIALEKGGVTSHTAIVARTLEIPAVVGCGPALGSISPGTTVIVDGMTGTILVNPDGAQIKEYQAKLQQHLRQTWGIKALQAEPAVTTDGKRVGLNGNIAKPQEALAVREKGGDGIGLFRTEFLYLGRKRLPPEEEQFRAYQKAAALMGKKPCIIRTMDLGGDKQPQNLAIPPESNPFLGYRAIRICLQETDLFKTQLRAILRASVFGNLRVMFPMISGLEELRAAKAIWEEVKLEMDRQAIPFDRQIKVGIMVETPAAAMIADLLAAEVDFFSIGTNDLCQYSLAVDRLNEKVGYLYNPLHPGMLRMIKNVIDAGHQAGIPVGMCGEMASGPENALILLGLGLDEFSMTPAAIPHIKKMIRGISMEKAQQIAAQAMKLTDAGLITNYLKEQLPC